MSILILRTALRPKKNTPATSTKMVIGFLSAVLINPMVDAIQLKFINKQPEITGRSCLEQQGLPDIRIDNIPFRLRLVEDEGRRRHVYDRGEPVLVQGLFLNIGIRSRLYLYRRLPVI